MKIITPHADLETETDVVIQPVSEAFSAIRLLVTSRPCTIVISRVLRSFTDPANPGLVS